jgi:hypothetical protein
MKVFRILTDLPTQPPYLIVSGLADIVSILRVILSSGVDANYNVVDDRTPNGRWEQFNVNKSDAPRTTLLDVRNMTRATSI